MDLKIYVAIYAKYDLIHQNEYYIPLQVGKAIGEDLGILGDDTGDNISDRPLYTELRGQYWFWKNTNSDYVGLVHYRRYFPRASFFWSLISEDKFEVLMDEKDVEYYLKDYDMIVLKVYLPTMTMRSHCNKRGYGIYLDLTGEVIRDICPEYYEAFNKVMDSYEIYPNNMYIASKAVSDKFCEWIFSVLFEVEKRLPIDNRPVYPRVMGCICEVLFKVWLDKEKMRVKYMPRIKIDNPMHQYHPFRKYNKKIDIKPVPDEELISSFKSEYLRSGARVAIVFGLAEGDYALRLLKELPEKLYLIIIEPDPDRIRVFIEERKYVPLIEFENRLLILAFDQYTEAKLERILGRKSYVLLEYPKYSRYYKEDFEILEYILRENQVIRYEPLDSYDAFVPSFEENKNGERVLKIKKGEKELYMGSKYNLKSDITPILEKISKSGKDKVVIFGLGSGEYVSKLPKDKEIIILEPKPEIIEEYMSSVKDRGEASVLRYSRAAMKDIASDALLIPFTNYDKMYTDDFEILKARLS